jgi:hypothetical protein
MSGATVATPNSIAAMQDNPAGFAMFLGGLAAQINSQTLQDPELNRSADHITEYQGGVGTSVPPWGFGVTYYSPSSEHVADSEISVREIRATVSRLVGPKTSFGVSLQYDKGIRRFDGNDLSTDHFSFQVGALYKLGDHWVMGASYTPAIDISPSGDNSVNAFGFNQKIRVPSVTAFGFGFMPNRFFKAGLEVLAVGGTPDTALLYDQTIGYGNNFTLQPRLGASYILVEYEFLKVELAAGTYYEVSRINGQANREHGTFGLDINPWFINTGVGTDMAKGYSNWTFSVGIDLVRTARTFEIIPKDTVAPFNGEFPPIFKLSADGLADGFTQGESKNESPPTAAQVQKIVTDIPKRMEEKLGGIQPLPPPKPKKRRRHKPALNSIKAVRPEDRQL